MKQLWLSVCFVITLPAVVSGQVIPSQFDILLDLDRDAATGCDVVTADGTFGGAELRLTTSVDGMVVTSVERSECVNPATDTFGPPVLIDAGDWPIGFGNGEAGFNVIETYLPIDISSFTGARVGVVASDALSNTSTLFVVSPGGTLPIVIEGLTPVPLVDGWLLAGLVLTLIALAMIALRRRGAAALVALVLVAGAGRAVLLACTLDGQTSDWNSGQRLAGTNASDPSDGVEIRALFGTIDGGRLCFRIDAALVEDSTTLSASTPLLALSINSPGADPPLAGNARVITITNTGSSVAQDVQLSTSGFPAGTSITGNTCSGTLNPGATCTLTITPGGTASPDVNADPCTTAPGTAPVATTLTIEASNAAPVDVDVLVLGYGCIYEGGFLFSIDDAAPSGGSIRGKVAALNDEAQAVWSTIYDSTGVSITDGEANSNVLLMPVGQYPAAQACLNKTDEGFSDWYLPAICELGRYVGLGSDPGCGTTTPNLYTTLRVNGLGGLSAGLYWSSSAFSDISSTFAWAYSFTGVAVLTDKGGVYGSRCVRRFSP